MKTDNRYQVSTVTTQYEYGTNPSTETTFRIRDTNSNTQPDMLPQVYFSEDEATAVAKELNALLLAQRI